MKPKLDKNWFYENLKGFKNPHLPIHIDMPLNRENLRYRLIFSWSNRKPNGDFNPIMYCQLIDTTKQGYHKYVVPDLIFDCIKEKVTTDFKLYKYLDLWVNVALERYEE